ncbi:MAG: hypothetical protein FJY83_01085 [Candidatus Aminicenantes bacterium]|nr:hypothetical protein [Candidatus Aminicenantes bacterium]
MRKTAFWGMALACLAAAPARAGVDLTFRGQVFLPAESAFREIYGPGIKAGAEIGISLTGRLDLWAGGDYLARSGKLTYTEENTHLSLIPLGLGVRYRFLTGAVSLYASAGMLACLFRESNAIGVASRTGLGGVGKVGVFLRVARGFFLQAGLGYSYCPMKPADFEIDVGGLEAGAGLAVRF